MANIEMGQRLPVQGAEPDEHGQRRRLARGHAAADRGDLPRPAPDVGPAARHRPAAPGGRDRVRGRARGRRAGQARGVQLTARRDGGAAMSRGAPAWKFSDVAWRGGRRPYDLVREVIISFVIVLGLAVTLAIVVASPDPQAVTLQQWATQSPKDFLGTTLREVTYTSLSAQYGPPYEPASQQTGNLQQIGFISPEKWVGVDFPLNTFQDYVAKPLGEVPGRSEE